ncbi:MAG: sortase [bacterium]|nr:sortase [bacterium]
MWQTINYTVWLVQAGKKAYERRGIFLGLFVFALLGSIVVLARLDLLPSISATEAAIAAVPSPNSTLNAPKIAEVVELPARIEIPAIGLSASISNPTATNIEILDEKLLAGAVRYPTSASLGETGNVVLFGHSSYLPIVGNQAYKTFNGIQKLSAGDVVTVYSVGTAYTYRVKSVAKESAASGAGIDLAVSGRVLTLATCNSFGTKTDRFVVVADFVESHSIPL